MRSAQRPRRGPRHWGICTFHVGPGANAMVYSHLSAMHILTASGVGERNVVEKIVRSQAEIRIKLFRLLIFIFFCRGIELIAAKIVDIVFYLTYTLQVASGRLRDVWSFICDAPPCRGRMFLYPYGRTIGAPENLLIFGKSGGSGRPNNDGVVGQCDPLAERERHGFCHTSCVAHVGPQ